MWSFLSVALLFFFTLQAADPILNVGSQKQLFIDKRFITADQGVHLRMNPPVKKDPVIVPDRPWELGWVLGWGTMLEDGGKYKMWYPVLPPVGKIDQTGEGSLLCYAESADGINWTKPNLDIFEWQGSKANNILLRVSIETATVFIDPKASEAERYKLLATFYSKEKVPNEGSPGMYIYTSPDGLRWKFHPTLLFPFTPDSQNQAFYDTRINKYVIYVRQWEVLEAGLYGPCCRNVGRIETDDILKPWPYAKGITPKLRFGKDKVPPPSGEVPVAFSRDEQDPKWSDHYTSAAVQYPWAADAYFMFPSAYLHYPNPPEGKFRNDGPVDIQMAVSRDGVKYHRPERKPYIELGPDGSQDSGSIYMLVGMLRRGNEIHQYYGGFTFTHGGYHGLAQESRIGAIFRVVQRLDGFISADAGMEGGSFTTPPLRFEGKRLELNMNASAMGEVRVELRDEKDAPVPGFSFEESDPLHMNKVAQAVSWNGKPDLQLIKQPIKIAFRLRSVKLYAFQFVT